MRLFTTALTAVTWIAVLANGQMSAIAQDVAIPGLLDQDLLDPENFGKQQSDRAASGGPGPLTEVAGKMALVVQDLVNVSTGEPTQEKQKKIVSQLDLLIEQLEKECAACRGGGRASANPNRGLTDSVVAEGPGGSGDLHDPREHGKRWGQLPAHQRDRILQSLTEGFPPHYQRILERYYRRIASGESSSGDEDSPDGDSPDGDSPDGNSADRDSADNGATP